MVKKLLIPLILFSVCFGQAVSISGVVQNAKGKGVKKADITLTSLDGVEIASTKSKRKGYFIFEEITPDEYLLSASHKKAGQVQVQLVPNELGNTDIVDLKLQLLEDEPEPNIIPFGRTETQESTEHASLSELNFSGTVLNNKGKGVKKVTLTLVDSHGNKIGEVESDRKGNFSIENISPQVCSFIAYHSELGTFKRKFIPDDEGNKSIDNFIITLPDTTETQWIYTFGNRGPLSIDPTLSIDPPIIQKKIGKMLLTWESIAGADHYELYEGDALIFDGIATRYEIKAKPGETHCYSIRVKGIEGLYGPMSDESCGNSLIPTPMNLASVDSQNTISLSWLPTIGANAYNIFRNDAFLTQVSETQFQDIQLEYGTTYQYKISAIDPFGGESAFTHPVQSTTRESIQAPLLSSLESDGAIVLIWNEVELARNYKIYREGHFIKETKKTTFIDSTKAGSSYCYEITAIDEFQLESSPSNPHCGKVPVHAPENVNVIGESKAVQLSWDIAEGAVQYAIYKSQPGGDFEILSKTNELSFLETDLGYEDSLCYAISSFDQDGFESHKSKKICVSTKAPPELKVVSVDLVEPSANQALDARESGFVRLQVHNLGESPANEIIFTIYPDDASIPAVVLDTVKTVEKIESGETITIDFDIFAELKVATLERNFSLYGTELDGYHLKEPYEFSIQTVAVVPPKILFSDFAISNEFGIHYIPKDEIVTVIGRIQNVGEGMTEHVQIKIMDNQSFTLQNNSNMVTIGELKPGAFHDFSIQISSDLDHFTIPFISEDYLGVTREHAIDLEVMKHYRGPKDLISYPIGTMTVDPYPEELSDIDVENHIPIGKRNGNALAIVFGVESYDDMKLPKVEFANRDIKYMRTYLQNTFGMDDHQVIPSKLWHMEGGPTLEDFTATFDPHQGDLRHRIVTSNKYSGVESLDIYIYYNGLGKHINGNPYILPKDANAEREVSQYPLETFLTHLSMVSVLNTVNSITVLLDIKWLNKPTEVWEYPYLSEKVSVIAASGLDQTSDYYTESSHSYFTYSILKSLNGADDGDGRITFSEFTELIESSMKELNSKQKPHIISSEKDRILVEYYRVD